MEVTLSSCDSGGDDPTTQMTKQEEVTSLLVGAGSTPKTWTMQSVAVDGVDKSTLFGGMTIKFTAGTFTVANGGPLWPATGTWTFTSDQAITIKRDDGTEVQVQATATSLKLTMTWNKKTFGTGRTTSVSGQHVFTFG